MHFVFGTAMHEAIQHYLQTMYDKSAAKADNIDIRNFFKGKMTDEYNKYKKKNKDRHFSTPEQMNEFFQDGVAILEWFKKHKRGRKAFFSPRQSELVGIEIPLILQPIKERPNIKYMGYVDLVIKDKNSGEYTIYDIKTSTKGWSKWEKGDTTKSQQLLLYKNYYSELFKVPKDKINIEFFIVKRKVLDFDDDNLQSPHQAYRIQSFKPTDNPKRLREANEDFVSFIRECYTAEGQPIDKEFPKCPTKLCNWCEFGKNRELCGEGLSPDEKFFTLG
tara:strand:+ start:426 stop:1253 length:828 start_codon:yes stop_codon:yes gene_type:complete